MATHKNIKNEILELRRSGKTYREIESQLNCVRSTIHYHCKRHNITDVGKKKYAIDDKTKLAIAEFCKEHTIIEARKHFKVSKSTIFKYRNFQIKKDEQK